MSTHKKEHHSAGNSFRIYTLSPGICAIKARPCRIGCTRTLAGGAVFDVLLMCVVYVHDVSGGKMSKRVAQ